MLTPKYEVDMTSVKLWHNLSVYIMCQYNLFIPKLGHMTRTKCWISAYSEVYTPLPFWTTLP